MTAGRNLSVVFEKQGKRLRRIWQRAQRDYSEKAVHDLRVAIRRFLSTVDFYLYLKSGFNPRKCQKVLRGVLDASSPLRDFQVQKAWIESQPKSRELGEFGAAIARKETRAVKGLTEILSGQSGPPDPVSRAQRKILKAFGRCTRSEMRDAAIAAVDHRFSQLSRKLSEVNPADAESIHHVRVALKRFRYAAEVARPFTRQLTLGTLERARNAQSRLGAIQDLEMLIRELRRWIEKQPPGRVRRMERMLAALESDRLKNVSEFAEKTGELAGLWNPSVTRS